jgi:hypothetical protein
LAQDLAHYAERDGARVLQVEGGIPEPASVVEQRKAEKAKVDEFRANNLALTREIDELKKRFEGIDPEEVHKLPAEQPVFAAEKRSIGGRLIILGGGSLGGDILLLLLLGAEGLGLFLGGLLLVCFGGFVAHNFDRITVR